MPTLNGVWRPHAWRDWEIELVDAAWDTVDVITDAVGLTADWALYGHGDGSLSVHLLSSLATDLLTEANWYLKLYRDGVHLRDFMLAKTDQGYAVSRQRTDEYVKVQLSPLDMLLKGHFCLPETAGNKFVTPELPIDDAFKWIVDHVCGSNAYTVAGGASRVISGLAVAADESDHPTLAELDVFHNADLFDALQKYGPTYEVDWRVRLIKGSGQANVPTFETFYPARGLDKTTDNGARMPVIINDASGEVISARRYLPRVGFANVVIAKSAAKELADAASVAIWGRREALVDSGADERLAGDLQAKSQRAGDEVEFAESEMVEVGAEAWQVQPGDWVRVGSHQVGIAHHDAFVRSAHFELTKEGDEKVKLVFGEYEKSLADKMKEGGGSGSDEEWEEGGGVCLWRQVDAGGAIYLTQATPGRELRIKAADDADLFYVDVAGNVGGKAYGGSYLDMVFTGYDLDIHDVNASGDIISVLTSSGSDIRWVADGDEIYTRTLFVDSDSSLANHSIAMDGATGDTTWKAGAKMTWEAVPYRMPTDAPADGEALMVTPGSPNLLKWDNPTPAAHAHDHGALTGLGDDDHSQYLLAAGSRALTGHWNAGAFNITASQFIARAGCYVASHDAGYLTLYAGSYLTFNVGSSFLAFIGSFDSANALFPASGVAFDIGTPSRRIRSMHLNTEVRWANDANAALYRSGASTLKTDGYFVAALGLTSLGDVLFYGDGASNRSLAGHRHGNKTGGWKGIATWDTNYNSNWLRKTDGTIVYIANSAISTSGGTGWTLLAIGSSDHAHTIVTPYGSP